ncbi:response regulator [Fimbriiglobus ruber]|uniref:histidine kinase n=1 Tax=Fimbriiglobus ruber TaxID=1908690 RepID=A0A225DYG3_9BACT|nr:response regulator [Fimbriiglobus ruber]OWK46401.1 chemotaxis protein CheY [Fimbriiglobus ruber]
MIDLSSRKARGSRAGTDLTLSLGLAAVMLFFIVSGAISYLNTRTLSRGARQVVHSHDVISALDDIVSLMKDAETGQRGYLITGDLRYLEPHTAAVARVDERFHNVEQLTGDNPDQQAHLPALKHQIDVKLRELAETIDLRRTRGFEPAREVVVSDRGKAAMDIVRTQVSAMQQIEKELLAKRLDEMDGAFQVAVASGILTGLLGAVLSGIVAYLVRRAVATRRRQEWLQSGEVGLAKAVGGDQRVEPLGDAALKFLAEYLDAHAGAFFTKDGERFRRAATYGIPATNGTPEQFVPGEGLLGQAAKDDRTFFVHDVPEGYLTIGSALGQGQPRHLAIAPFAAEDAVNAVIELGFIHPPDDATTELLEKVSESVGVAVRSANYRAHLQNLLEETQRQSEELQAQGEELRVSNEEIEEQSRVLKESQSRLEEQQVELERANVQLEEHAQFLETQRDDLSRAKTRLQTQADDLAQASRYKSDFLANMSHELRTPLNSSLILAKLLADNPQGNLSTEQVRYAETIQSAGNDLLTLINDILDLSKIEAGHMEIRPEPVRLAQLADDLGRIFQPVAEQKGLKFHVTIMPGCPDTLDTDRQRLEQVLKNLLSNALKFTEKGAVELRARRATDGRIAFAVTDTGIGIPEHQQQMVFEAFRQADGTTNRKYGGTGLGLSISRELTRLLGGDMHLASEPGRGSTFTVTLPASYDPSKVQPRAPAPTREPAPIEDPPGGARANPPPDVATKAIPAAAPSRSWRTQDDRERLTGNSRVILVVEDDLPFARILYELAHELGFECLIATTAEEALAVAVQYLPGAVVLDIGLPDHSGLSVLDRLKHDARTRHIPVHVVSAGDYAQTALSLGAVGYMLKPVKRDELADTLKRLETRFAQRMRRVLVVEDDPVQLDSLRRLLGSHEVETVGAGSAAECLDRLKGTTFDCMVLDLALPDATGYSLLETLSREDAYAFPPVIVYTGRDLSADEEQRLRRYSKSIIIKGAKSPERLLDEVTLFLHQVVSELPAEQQKMLEKARSRDAALEGRRILVVEDDVRNVFALTSILEPRGAVIQIARNGQEALTALERVRGNQAAAIDLVLMDVMMPEMDGITATREIRKCPEWKKLPVIMLTAKAMPDDQERCLDAGANDYMAKPLDVEKLLSLVRVWMPR